MGWFAVAIVKWQNLDIPETLVAASGIGGAPEAGRPPCRSGFDRIAPCRVALVCPKTRPWTSLQSIEVVDFHDALAAFGNEEETAIEIKDLDAVIGGGKNSFQQR